MALISVAKKAIYCQVVYYGTDMSGRMTALDYIHQQFPVDLRSRIAYTDNPYTMCFYCIHPTTIRGFQIYFYLYANPGVILDQQERVAILERADGVVFVLDSQAHKLQENRPAFQELLAALRAYGKAPERFPIVLQYNKRDLPKVLAVRKLDQVFNTFQWPRFETVATTGVNVLETFNAICAKVIAAL